MFDGMENNSERIHADPPLPLNAPGMKLCVNVLAAGRPNYLYICLDSVFRNTVFKSESDNLPDVYLYVDVLSGGQSFAEEMLEVASHFPVRGVFVNDKHKGIAANFWDSFSQSFLMGYDFCVLLEEDWLICTDALQWLYDVPKIASHYSLYRWTDRMNAEGVDAYEDSCYDGEGYTVFENGRYVGWCSAFAAAGFGFIHNVVQASGGLTMADIRAGMPHVRRFVYADWDRVLSSVLNREGLLSMVPPRSLLAHFGCQTCQEWGYGDKENCHSLMFDGDKADWVENVVEIFASTTNAEKEQLSLRPFDFVYS